MKSKLAMAIAIAFCTTLLSCDVLWYDEHTFLNEDVHVNYMRSGQSGSGHLTFTFFKEGTYHVSFSATPGGGCGQEKLPDDFEVTIPPAPWRLNIAKGDLAGYLRITITRAGKSEFRDFS